MNIDIPEYVDGLLNRLEKNSYEAFIVGGSVRDSLLGKNPSDYDITTDALPEEIEEVFKDYRTVEVGKKFGTIIVVQEEGNVEITTYRVEGEYKDGRRPSQLAFTSNIVADLKRRDFTINAMAYSKTSGLVDEFNGRKDLKDKVIRTVGDASRRFGEDYLRILRCIRFSTELDFSIEDETFQAAKVMSAFLEKISSERVREEIFKILVSRKPSKGIKLLKDIGALEVIIPEITYLESAGISGNSSSGYKGNLEHNLCVLDKVPEILETRLAALLQNPCGVGTCKSAGNNREVRNGIARDFLERLNTSNYMIDGVELLVKEKIYTGKEHSGKELKKLINTVGKSRIFQLIELEKANMECKEKVESVKSLNKINQKIMDILNKGEPISKKQLDINGADIVRLGYVEGKIIGDILDYLLERVLEKPELNKKEILREIVLSKFKQDKMEDRNG